MIRRPPRSTLSSSSAASDVYKRQVSTQSTGILDTFHAEGNIASFVMRLNRLCTGAAIAVAACFRKRGLSPLTDLLTFRCCNIFRTLCFDLSLIHISEPTRPY
eukprot:TRINITY_DN1954_c0_g1_i5.p1 TRINITY_DN1954_c0_g1~~TRINITY_DN1954_c0_g1_i5.p1  ORF type:complete len:103 (+),score=21.54 TRINITY_DN1954_c0_g1_i5:69-377(+)